MLEELPHDMEITAELPQSIICLTLITGLPEEAANHYTYVEEHDMT